MNAKRPGIVEAFAQLGHPFLWTYPSLGLSFISRVLCACPKCGTLAIVELPAVLRAAQLDGTTHVCHPAVGGCNHGFALEPGKVSP